MAQRFGYKGGLIKIYGDFNVLASATDLSTDQLQDSFCGRALLSGLIALMLGCFPGSVGWASAPPEAATSAELAPVPIEAGHDTLTVSDEMKPSFLQGSSQTAGNSLLPVTDHQAALREAYWNNPKLLSERARLRSTDYKLPLARAEFGPKIDFRVGRGYQRANRASTLASTPEIRAAWVTTASVILSMPLYTFGRLAADERSAWAEIAYGRASLQSVEADTLFDALNAYNLVMRDRQGVAIAQDNLLLIEQELRDNRARFVYREVTITDVQQVETRLEQAKAQLNTAQREVSASEASFLRVIGGGPGITLAPLPALTMPVPTLDTAYAYADKHNPVILAALARERVSRAQRDAAKAALLPRIDLSGSAQTSIDQPFNVHRETDLRGEVIVSGPIFHSGANATRIAEASAANDADWRLIDSARRDIHNEVADAWNEWRTQLALIDRYKLAGESADSAYQGALLQEKAGMRTTLDVLDLAREILLTKSSYNNAIAAAFTANVRLLQALGVLKFERLLPEDDSYDPEQHLDKVKSRNDLPIVTPLLRALDGIAASHSEPPSRDPAAKAGIKQVLMGPPAGN